MIKDGISSFQMHAIRIDKLCFLACEYAKWFLIIHAVKTQLLKLSHGVQVVFQVL
jgi:hypothetical protein